MTQPNPHHDRHDRHDRHDVVVLGGHLATGLLAAVLARHGVRVALVPTSGDRDVPSGETTIPYTAELFFLLGARFGIPEIAALGMFGDLPAELRGSGRAKRNLGFLYHRADRSHRTAEALQFAVPGEHAEWHVHRPEADAYAIQLAGRLGATVADAEAVPHGVRVGRGGVSVELAGGGTVDAEYLVDGSGAADLLPAGLPAPDPGRVRHRARLLHTHFTGVAPFESVVPPKAHRRADPWSEGTLLHTFAGGWMQLAHFGHAEGGGPGRCSVTLSLDPDVHPAGDGEGPDEEFARIVARYPDIARQFLDAVPVRPWRRVERWPAVVDRCSGPRWFLFDRSAGRHDLLLSRDLSMSLELVHATAAALLEMGRARDWAGERMKPAADFQLRLFDFHDRLVAAGRHAAADFPLWNAYLRVWLLWTILSAMSLKRARLEGEKGRSDDDARWSPVERFEDGEYWYRVPGGLPDLVSGSLRDLLDVPARLDGTTAAGRVYARLRRSRFVPPLFRFGDPDARYYRFGRLRRLRMLLWVRTSAPDDFRRLLTLDNVTAVAESRAVPARTSRT
ncbi:NAD(P)/FAD-dependent oxidoreductase [Actinomadura sp. 9N215]|uniref:NAD(P)/FAD-dependent oxidoreductase n=1 Tax=Actinomadura sp. 9N215 TaxID=3375150 RepID=UPI0037A661FB